MNRQDTKAPRALDADVGMNLVVVLDLIGAYIRYFV
jgi:hypothetical protein